MAANYWLSTQCNQWLLDRTQIELAREEDALYATEHELAAVQIWISTQAIYLCKRLSLRQRVVATACVFLRRFFAKNSYAAVDLLLTMAACVYVAAKVEESPVHIKSVCAEATRQFEQIGYRCSLADISSVAEMEFYLLEELEFDLVIYHPYRTLISIYEEVGAEALKEKAKNGSNTKGESSTAAAKSSTTASAGLGLSASSSEFGSKALRGEAEIDAGLFLSDGSGSGTGGPEAGKSTFKPVGIEELDELAVQLAWFVINDTYTTDLPLLHPPHLIAIAAIWLALLLHPPSRRKLYKSAQESHARRTQWRREVDEMLYGRSGPSTSTAAADAETRAATASESNQPGAAAAGLEDRSAEAITASGEGGRSVPDLFAGVLPSPPAPPSEETLTWLASLNVSIPLVAEIVRDMVASYDREAKVRRMTQDSTEMVKRLERMREARRKRLVKERTLAAGSI